MELRVAVEELLDATEVIAPMPGGTVVRAIYPASGFSSLPLRIG